MVLEQRKRVTKSPEERREELLDAAMKVFASKGVSAATVADITEAAGVAKGTFYLYFDSKEHLVAALRERFVDEITTHAAKYVARVGREDWWALAEAVVEGFIDFPLEHRDEMKIFYLEPRTAATNSILAECEQRMIDMLASGIQAGIDAGAFKVSDPKMTATFLHHAIDGSIMHAIMSDEEPDRDRLVEAAKEMHRKLLAP